MARQPPEREVITRRLGLLIKAQRRARGLTQHELADVLGIGHTTIENYEQGLNSPPFDVLVLIANHCDVPLSVFLSPLDDVSVPCRTVRAERQRAT